MGENLNERKNYTSRRILNMAFTTPTNVSLYVNQKQTKKTFVTTGTGAQDGGYIDGDQADCTLQAKGSDAALAMAVQVTASPRSDVDAGTALWLDVTGLTAIANVVKTVKLPYPATAWRLNVGTAAAASTAEVVCLENSNIPI
jgi:hypothetical protein